jgi:hypothetical protein
MPDTADLAGLMKRPAVTSRRVGGGIYVAQGDRGFLIKEPRLEAVIPRLLAMLDGTRPAASVRAALPEKLQIIFDLLWNGLAANNMLTRAPSGAMAPDTPAPVLRTMQNAIADWEPCLAAWRARPITLWVDFDLVHLVVKPLIEQGVRQIIIVDQDGRACAAMAQAGVEVAGDGITFRPPAAVSPGADHRLLALVAAVALPDVLALANRHGRSIIGVVAAQGAAIAEYGTISRQDILDGCGLAMDDPPLLPPRHCLAVAAAMLAFEALRGVITEFSADAAAIDQRRHAVRMVHLDGTVITHDRRVAAVSRRKIAAVADHLAPDIPRPLVAPTDPWHHPGVGPFADVVDDGPAFPLPHAAKLVRWMGADGTQQQTLVTAWGVDPAEAARRCQAQAFEILCGGMRRLAVAAADAEAAARRLQLQQAALAIADPGRPVDFDAGWSPDVTMLARLARIYWGETPHAVLAGSDAAWLARIDHADTCAVGIGLDADAALRAALGDWISTRQLSRPTTRQLRSPWRDLRSATRTGRAPRARANIGFQTFDAGAAPVVVVTADPD